MHRGWNCGDYFADGITNGASWYSLSKGKGWAGEHPPQQKEVKRNLKTGEETSRQDGLGKDCGNRIVPITRHHSGVCTSDQETAWEYLKWLMKEPQK